MSIDQKDKVDLLSISPDGKVMLTISDHLPWDENKEHLFVLQDKLNSYLIFIESGEIFESYPTAKNKSFIIDVVMKYKPNKVALVFLTRTKETFENIGVQLRWRKLD